MIKLNIGSGNLYRTGWINIDLEKKYHPDVCADFRTLNYENVDEINASHLLEHFSREEALRVLKQCHSWLKVGGRISIDTPDIDRICEFITNPSTKYWANKEWMVRALYGSQEAEWAYHRDGWYKKKFEKILPELGFKVVLIKQRHNYIRYGEKNTRYRLPNILVVAEKIDV